MFPSLRLALCAMHMGLESSQEIPKVTAGRDAGLTMMSSLIWRGGILDVLKAQFRPIQCTCTIADIHPHEEGLEIDHQRLCSENSS